MIDTIDTDYLRNKSRCIDLGVVKFAYWKNRLLTFSIFKNLNYDSFNTSLKLDEIIINLQFAF